MAFSLEEAPCRSTGLRDLCFNVLRIIQSCFQFNGNPRIAFIAFIELIAFIAFSAFIGFIEFIGFIGLEESWSLRVINSLSLRVVTSKTGLSRSSRYRVNRVTESSRRRVVES
jgi:hypothetical protein